MPHHAHDHAHAHHEHGEHAHHPISQECNQDTSGTSLRINVPVILPEGPDCDACGQRIVEAMQGRRGVQEVHLDREGDAVILCLHYDPNLLTLEALERQVEAVGGEVGTQFQHRTWMVRDMDCADCAMTIEHVIGRLAGVQSVVVNYAAEKMRVEYDAKAIQARAIQKKVRWLGYEVQEPSHDHGHGEHDHDHAHGSGLKVALLSGLFLALGFLGETFTNLPVHYFLPLYIGAYITGGYDATRHGVRAALKLRFDIEFLMVVAAIGAAILGEWAEGALLLFLFSLGHALEHSAMDKARHAMHALGEITPKTARVHREGAELEIPVAQVQRGDEVIVRPGERLPVDGVVIRGQSSLDQAAITGESIPVEARAETSVFAGSVNGDGSLRIRTTKLSSESTMARIVKLVEEAQTQKSSTQRFTERFSRIFVPSSLVFVALVIAVPAILNMAPTTALGSRAGLPISESFLRGMTILVAASPCALAISTPAAVLSGIAQAARSGVLVKGGAHLENLGTVNTVAFDKTGTLTMGCPEVTDLAPMDTDEVELLTYAAAAEAHSSHPLAKAIAARAASLDLPEAGDLQTHAGRGIETLVDGEAILVGNLKLFPDAPDQIQLDVDRFEEEGKTTMVVKRGDRFLGVIAVADQVRPEAAQVLAKLKAGGLRRIVMLTGDHERVAKVIASQVGVTEVRANLLPEDKVTAIQDLSRDGPVAMVGDGINDAPAMANATVGIAMAAHGTDVAMETADVALMADSLDKLPFALGVSKSSRRIIQQNLFVSLGTIALLIPFALFGWAGIGIAIIFHEGSTLLVVGNALRLLRYGATS